MTKKVQRLEGNFEEFTGFMRRLVAVPHSEIMLKLEAEKQEKKEVKNDSRAPGASSRKP